jgi:hypothetical protein
MKTLGARAPRARVRSTAGEAVLQYSNGCGTLLQLEGCRDSLTPVQREFSHGGLLSALALRTRHLHARRR